ncbi:MAG TPA: V-type ATP synthase subunit A, partial [bacterium]
MKLAQGQITGVSGSLVTAAFTGSIIQNELGYVVSQGRKLKSEVIRIRENLAFLQVFENTKGLAIGDSVEFTGEMLSVVLGPGLLGQIYDDLQNPLPELAERYGFFLPSGVEMDALPGARLWRFTPLVKKGDRVRRSSRIGAVPETHFKHHILVPFNLRDEYTVASVKPEGDYTVHEPIAELRDKRGNAVELCMQFRWPVKIPIRVYREKRLPTEPLMTKARIIDTLFPIAKGGTYCIPGPFGAGKTVLQQIISRYADVDIVIIAACGERAGEIVETMREFPLLNDPRTGRSLMERTIIIANTSSMPVAAREASVYTAATLGEYYRQQGLDVLLLADSTSRWAQAMRELSGRLEEIPGEEAFPAYLESRIAEFYERAGLVDLDGGGTGSLTIGGTVSPAGGNFDEPVTQATLKVVGAFLGLSRERSNARRFPAIHPLESWSKYSGIIPDPTVAAYKEFLYKGSEVHQMMLVIGEEGTSIEDFVVHLKSEFLDFVYLQQNAFDTIDAATPSDRQAYISDKIIRILGTEFAFMDKEEARAFFNDLRQKFTDLNYLEIQSASFRE